MLREPFSYACLLVGSPKYVSKLRAAALLAQSSQACLYLVCPCSFLGHAFQIVSISRFVCMSSLLKCLGSTCSWGIRKECGVASRGVPSLLFNVIATILSFFPVFQNAMQAVTVTGVCIVSREQHNHFDIQLFYLIWRDGTTPFWFRIQPVVTHFFFQARKILP